MRVKNPSGRIVGIPDEEWPKLKDKGFTKIDDGAIEEAPERKGQIERTTTSHPFLSIIVLAWNKLDLTKACVESILETTTAPFELIVVNQGSTDLTGSYLNELSERDGRVTPIHLGENVGVAGGRNVGIKAARGRFLAFFDNDSTVGPGWEEIMLSVFKDRPRAGFVGRQGTMLHGYTQNGLQEVTLLNDNPLRVDLVSGGATMVRAEVFKEIGLLDEKLGLFWHEDLEICLRAAIAGWRSYAVRFPWNHTPHSTYRSDRGDKWMERFESNLDYIDNKLRSSNVVRFGVGKMIADSIADELTRLGMVVIKGELPRHIPHPVRKMMVASIQTAAGHLAVLDIPPGPMDELPAALIPHYRIVLTTTTYAEKMLVAAGMPKVNVGAIDLDLTTPDVEAVADELYKTIFRGRA